MRRIRAAEYFPKSDLGLAISRKRFFFSRAVGRKPASDRGPAFVGADEFRLHTGTSALKSYVPQRGM